jgi:hypothetical protein
MSKAEDRTIERVDRERRRRVMQEARRRTTRARRHQGVNSRNRNALTCAETWVPEGWVRL